MDERIVSVGIQVGDTLRTYTGLAIKTTGTKYANPTQNECEVTITNLSKTVRDQILTEASPFVRTTIRKRLIVDAGRVSYGTSRLFLGDIVEVKPTQPPDIGLTLKAKTGNFNKGTMVSRTGGKSSSLKTLASQVAASNGLTLDFQATDKQIANYSHTGSTDKEVDKLGLSGGVSTYVDDGKLVVADVNVPLNGSVRYLSKDSGMIGIPEITEYGIKVTMLYDNMTGLGTELDVTSVMYPTCNGKYVVYKLSWDLATRDTPFYLVAEAKRLNNG